MSPDPPTRLPSGRASFTTTHWTVVLAAARPDAEDAQAAFASVYLTYWYPLYAYTRRRGYSPANAEDITQDFFVQLIEKRSLQGLEQSGGRFRSFLLRALTNFLANDWHRQQAQKRGGGSVLLSLNAVNGEVKYSQEMLNGETPEFLFEKQWVVALLAKVLEGLHQECKATGKGQLFEDLRLHLQGDRQGPAYADVASRHGLSEGAVKVTVHRLRQRYGELLREEIARTVSHPDEVEEELRYLKELSSR